MQPASWRAGTSLTTGIIRDGISRMFGAVGLTGCLIGSLEKSAHLRSPIHCKENGLPTPNLEAGYHDLRTATAPFGVTAAAP